tara:strand:+ start:48 stop:509 length:462 start_codon:yes stop_codon:yes gene_type:complete
VVVVAVLVVDILRHLLAKVAVAAEVGLTFLPALALHPLVPLKASLLERVVRVVQVAQAMPRQVQTEELVELAVSQFSQQGVATLEQVVLSLAAAVVVLPLSHISKAILMELQLHTQLVVLVAMALGHQQHRLLLRCLLLQQVAAAVLALRLRP